MGHGRFTSYVGFWHRQTSRAKRRKVLAMGKRNRVAASEIHGWGGIYDVKSSRDGRMANISAAQTGLAVRISAPPWAALAPNGAALAHG